MSIDKNKSQETWIWIRNINSSLDLLELPWRIDIKKLQNSGFFTEVNYKKWEIIISEWDTDNNIYIIISWEVAIEKLLHEWDKKSKKNLWILKKFDIFGEWSLNNNFPKQVSIVSLSNTQVLIIDSRIWFESFINKFPQEWFKLLKYIIELTNKRQLESNSLLTSTYEMNKAISEIYQINNKTIFSLIDRFIEIIWWDYIVYIENNPVMEGYYTLLYDTRIQWKMSDLVIEFKPWGNIWKKLLELEQIDKKWFNMLVRLNVWNINLWYFIIWRSNINFTENDKKIIFSITNSLSWLIRQKYLQQEQRDKEFMRG